MALAAVWPVQFFISVIGSAVLFHPLMTSLIPVAIKLNTLPLKVLRQKFAVINSPAPAVKHHFAVVGAVTSQPL